LGIDKVCRGYLCFLFCFADYSFFCFGAFYGSVQQFRRFLCETIFDSTAVVAFIYSCDFLSKENEVKAIICNFMKGFFGLNQIVIKRV
jgi:hypothetical protein